MTQAINLLLDWEAFVCNKHVDALEAVAAGAVLAVGRQFATAGFDSWHQLLELVLTILGEAAVANVVGVLALVALAAL